MMCLLDFALGSLYNLGPTEIKKKNIGWVADVISGFKESRFRSRLKLVLKIPVYSVLEGVEEVVESFSQSFSPFRLPVDGQDENPPAESGLHTYSTCRQMMEGKQKCGTQTSG